MAAAQREMREEVGYEFANWKLVKVVQPETKLEWFAHIFIADTIIAQHPPHNDSGERIIVHPTSFEDVIRYVHESRGWLGKSRELFENVTSIDDLQTMPEFQGKEVDR